MVKVVHSAQKPLKALSDCWEGFGGHLKQEHNKIYPV